MIRATKLSDSVKSRIDSVIASMLPKWPVSDEEMAEIKRQIASVKDTLTAIETGRLLKIYLHSQHDTIPDWGVMEFVRNLAEYDRSKTDAEFKREIADKFFSKYRKIVEAAYEGEGGIRALLDTATVKAIEESQIELYGKTTTGLSVATPARLFNYILVAYLYHAAKRSCEKSIHTGSPARVEE